MPPSTTFLYFTLFRIAVWVIGIPVIVWLMVGIVRRTRAIIRLDQKLREEAARNATNPYADMAKMYEAQELLQRARRKK